MPSSIYVHPEGVLLDFRNHRPADKVLVPYWQLVRRSHDIIYGLVGPVPRVLAVYSCGAAAFRIFVSVDLGDAPAPSL